MLTPCISRDCTTKHTDSHYPANTLKRNYRSDFTITLLRDCWTDTERGVLLGLPKSAICVQRFDDSLNSAIRITYRISLRSSSLREPRYPLLRVVFFNVQVIKRATTLQLSKTITYKKSTSKKVVKIVFIIGFSSSILIDHDGDRKY